MVMGAVMKKESAVVTVIESLPTAVAAFLVIQELGGSMPTARLGSPKVAVSVTINSCLLGIIML